VLSFRGETNRYVPEKLGDIPQELRAFITEQLGLLWDRSDNYPWYTSIRDYHVAQVRKFTGWRFLTVVAYCTASFSVCSLRPTKLPIIYPDLRLDYKVATHPVCYIADVNLVRMRSEWKKFVSSKSAKISVFQRLHKSSICSPAVNFGVGVSLRSLDAPESCPSPAGRVYCARAKSRPDDSVHLVLPYSCAGYRLPFQTLSNSVSWRHNVCIVVSNLSSRTADCR